MSRFEECIEKGLIRKQFISEKRAENSLVVSERFLGSAGRNFEINEYEMCLIASYNSIFHSCRALLFSKGYTERNHLCMIVALVKLYNDDKILLGFLNSIDKIRISRHEVQYMGEFSSNEEATFVLKLAKDFLVYVKNNNA